MAQRYPLVPPSSEERITLSEASAMLTRRGTPASHMSLWRWTTQGKKSHNGPRIFLEAERVGRRLYTTAEAIDRFVSRVTDESWRGHQPGLAAH